jgi:hypothetical protein
MESIQLIRRFGLLYRNTNNGFVIFYKKEPWKKVSLEKLLSDQKLRFTFLIKNKNPYFVNFSNLPFDMRGQLYHFSNTVATSDTDKVFLHPSAKVTEEELIAVSSKRMTIKSEEESLKLELKDVFGESHYQEELPVYGNKVNADFSFASSGRYSLYGNAEKYDDIFMHVGTGKIPFAAVEIALEEGNNTVLEGGTIQPKSYYISFASRKVYWRYLVSNEQMNGLSDASILDKRKSLYFYSPDKKPLINGREMVSIESTETITLSHRQIQQLSFKAKKKKNGTGKLTSIDIDLPLPSYKKLNPINKELVYADVFISL